MEAPWLVRVSPVESSVWSSSASRSLHGSLFHKYRRQSRSVCLVAELAGLASRVVLSSPAVRCALSGPT